jgi:hypothetical protein
VRQAREASWRGAGLQQGEEACEVPDQEVPAFCYIANAAVDRDSSLGDEAGDLNRCFNPYMWVKDL